MSSTARRAQKRMKVMWSGTVRRGERFAECQVLDISAGGAKIRIAGPCPVRSEVALITDRLGALPGKISWRRGDLAGIEFSEDRQIVQERLLRVLPQLALFPELVA